MLCVQGDTYIKMFEVTDAPPYVFFLTMYQSTTSGRAMCSMPKKEMDYMKCEVMRFFKVQNNLVEPISMTVPRKVGWLSYSIHAVIGILGWF